MSFVVWKYKPEPETQSGRTVVYLSPTGRWIKNPRNAAAFSQEKAQEQAELLKARVRVYSFRS